MLGIARSRSEKRITLPRIDGTESRASIFLPRDGALLLRLPQRTWAYSVSASITPLTHFFVRTSYFISVMRNSRLCNGTEENTMTLDAPEPIAAYLAAEEAKDADALSRCFTEDGTVHDEGRDYRGREAIRQWPQPAADHNQYRLQPVNTPTPGNNGIARAHRTREFPERP